MFPNVNYAGNIGAHFAGVFGLAANTVTAGGGADNVTQYGSAIDRFALAELFESCKVQVPVRGVLGQAETAVFELWLQDSADGSTWADYTYRSTGDDLAASSLTLTGDTGGSTEVGVVEHSVDLAGARQHIRIACKPNLSRANTDTLAIGHGIVNFGGGPRLPVTV